MFGSISAFHRGLAGMTFALLLAGILPAPIAQAAGQSAGDQTTMNTTGTFIPELDLPGVFSGPQTSDSGLLARYLRAVFIYFIWVVGIVAGVMVVYAGVRWISAAGNPGQIKEAREILDGAVIGVIIALTSVLLLNIINPRRTELTLPGIAPIKQQPVGGSEAVTLCAREASDTKTPCGTFAKLPFQVTKKTADVAGTVESSADPRFKVGDPVVVVGCGLSETVDGGFTLRWKARIPVGDVVVEESGLDLVLVEDGLITRNEVYFDRTALLRAMQAPRR